MKLFALMLLSVFGLVSCSGGGKGPGNDVKTEAICQDGSFVLTGQNGIIGGQAVGESTWLNHQTVYLFSRVSSTKGYACTGTLIDTNIVLTAAHCVDSVSGTYPSNFEVVFSAQPDCDRQSGAITSKKLYASRIITHPDWKSSATGSTRGDLAMIRLYSKAPTPWKPAHLAQKYVNPRSQTNLVAGFGSNLGYGRQSVVLLRATWLDGLHPSTQQRSEATYREAIRQSGGTEQDMAKVTAFFQMGEDKEMLFYDQSEGRGVCSGDSGGSAYTQINGRFDVVGVASAVMNTDNREESAACSMWGVHTSVTYHRKWIEETFQSLRNSDSSKTSIFE